ncbi:MAG TPA: hypothetical protein VHH73_16875 [Verrucomicrobiae bacterium]|nr:hypothetical protein [Verrucomicrobiae bacterium]
MSSPQCCQQKPLVADRADRQKTRPSGIKGIAELVLPGALLALMPKCPLCLAAYVALCTGFTMSRPSAHLLLRAVSALCIGTLAFCLARRVISWRQSKQTLNLQPARAHQ